MDLSVCLVTFQSRDTIARCLASVLAEAPAFRPTPAAGEPSARDGLEAIVVDNGSIDGTADLVHDRFPQVALVENFVNAGFAKAANQALRRAHGRYVLLLNPDVVVPAGTLAGMVRFLDHTPSAGAAGVKLLSEDGRVQGSCGFFPGRLDILARAAGIHRALHRLPRFRDRKGMDYFAFPESITEVDGVLGSFLMIRRSVLDEVGLLDESYFLYGEDIDWCRRARARGVKIVFHPGFTALHTQGASAASRPLSSLYHFYCSALRYHLRHEAPEAGPLVGAVAVAGLGAKAMLSVVRHFARVRPASRIFLQTAPPSPRAGRGMGPGC